MVIKVLLIDIDSKIPNLALMKLSRYFKNEGFPVYFRNEPPDPDMVYISCVFMKNKPTALGIAKRFKNVLVGGSGVNYDTLPDYIEYLMPDYDLYGIDYSMGFTSRGCFRNCDFCIVPEKEGKLREHQAISDFLHPDHCKVLLLDNNLLAAPNFKKVMSDLNGNGLKVNYNQGLDIRLINEDNAKLLLDTKSYDRKFNKRAYYFAFDDLDLKGIIEKKIQLLMDCGFNPRWLMFYFLCGFNSTHQDDMTRFQTITDFGCVPYVMKFNDRTDDPWLNHFDRYVNRKYHEFIPIEDYKNGVLMRLL